jgi:class 3 adenylate cyclase
VKRRRATCENRPRPSVRQRFLFADRGELVAKGFDEPVRVYEVKWRE